MAEREQARRLYACKGTKNLMKRAIIRRKYVPLQRFSMKALRERAALNDASSLGILGQSIIRHSHFLEGRKGADECRQVLQLFAYKEIRVIIV
jgi:hypothetical protein